MVFMKGKAGRPVPMKKVAKKKKIIPVLDESSCATIGPQALDKYVGDAIYVYKHRGNGIYHRYSGELVDKEQSEYVIKNVRFGDERFAREMRVIHGDKIEIVDEKRRKEYCKQKGKGTQRFIDSYLFIDESD